MSAVGLRVLPPEVIYFRGRFFFYSFGKLYLAFYVTGPYTRPCYEFLYLLNYTDRPIAFKLKTTSPHRFNVKPVKSIVAPGGGEMTVTLMLTPETEEGPFDRQRQKFMIEWSFITEDGETEDDVSAIVSSSEN